MRAYGVLGYSGTNNLGDEIQSIAAAQLLPRVDHYLNRDDLHMQSDRLGHDVFAVMNGWYCQWPERWPASAKIRPLLISMHVTQERVDSDFGLIPSEYLLAAPISTYLIRNGPVGARDLNTLSLLQRAGIPSYFSGCLTLTLDRPDVCRGDDLIVYNDIPVKVVRFLRLASSKRLFGTSHVDFPEQDQVGRIARAHELLHLYARASCVVTGRLHCALPCLAMGTPVLLIDCAGDQYRFAGLSDFLNHCTPDALLSGAFTFDVDNPPPNGTRHMPYREGLIKRVRDFVAESVTESADRSAFAATDSDRQATMINLFSRHGRPRPAWRARRRTYIKASPQNPDSADVEGNVAIRSGALLSADLYSQHEGRRFGRNVFVNGRRLDEGSWSIHASDWESL